MNLEPWKTVATGASDAPLVTAAQHLLRKAGQTIAADGSFGPATKAAVQAFQTAQGLAADGIVGSLTWRKLAPTIRLGDSGDAVKALQALELIYIPGDPPLTVDGQFGPLTEGRVALVQDLYGLATDNVVGHQTWAFATATNPWPLVRVGHYMHTNHRVKTVQHLLRAHGATIAADGYYGDLTGAAMKAFQATLRSDDLGTTCGQLDWPALVVTVRKGDKGDKADAVSAAQYLLYDITADGDFGPATEQAVKDFQQMWGLAPDGVVGPLTWEALVKPKFD